MRAARDSATPTSQRLRERRHLEASIEWRRSTSVGTANAGSVSRGVKLPHEGVHFFTLDPVHWSDVDLVLAQDVVDRFVAAGAKFVFVGPNTPLVGPAPVVQALPRHDDHLHVRLRAR